ncbi:MAG: 3-hydroxyacyl-[acyl-carrier-protein] dehydratase FabZ [Candidatus Muiribacterium halophilum]|uniref:Multifunctional fusion protein n=1 Tax=Muiribacterium halophilum TaxID=2053465 RepID=A0A2N5ZJ49_MUIH1|nr:MAG: 3-hydroxyacyl-[acyl-carrier-protein] dehydratase FabZ [Candidatus Muirbacterium halophilum]
MKQKTLGNEVRISGIGVHTGNNIEAILKPAKAGSGITFVRKDLDPCIRIKADIDNVDDVIRGTALKSEGFEVYTVEHVLAACAGLGIFNVDIEINSNEFPVADGSSKHFVELIREAGIKELDEEQEVFDVTETISVVKDDTVIIIKPHNEFKISFTIDYDHPVIGSQYLSIPINEKTFTEEIMFARTFGFYRDYEKLKSQSKAAGSSLENTIGLDDQQVLNEDGLRAPNEFVRHKILDMIGDLSLMGMPIRGHVVAVKVGHALNVEAARLLRKAYKKFKMSQNTFNINDIKKILPHRYPFLLVDRIVGIEDGKKAIGLKNVTVNEEFFNGHFPSRPVMPGVLIIEALAQVAGVFMLSKTEHQGKLPFFGGIDKFRFRRPVEPGDALYLEIEIIKLMGKIGKVKGTAKVDGKLVASGELMFSLVKA